MAPNFKLPPISWRHGDGYIHPEEASPATPNGPPTLFYPGGLFTIPSQGGFWAPPPPPGYSGFSLPPQFPSGFYAPPGYPHSGALHGFFAPPPQQQAPPSDAKKKDDTPDEYKLPEGLLPGSVLHHQDGNWVYFHVLGSTDVSLDKILKGSHDGFIDKRIHKFNENTSVEHVMKKLKAGDGGKMTQVFEKGGGLFIEGTSFVQGDDKAKKALKEFGWSGAGTEATIEPIWVVVQKKEDKKC